jgi:hypothetical protein
VVGQNIFYCSARGKIAPAKMAGKVPISRRITRIVRNAENRSIRPNGGFTPVCYDPARSAGISATAGFTYSAQL